MIKLSAKWLTLGVAATVAGCTGPAPLNLNPLSNAPNAAGKIDLVIARVVCELTLANGKDKLLADYVAVASVTVKVEDTGGLTPSLSVLDPLPVPTAATVSGEVTRGRVRSFTQYFVVKPGRLELKSDQANPKENTKEQCERHDGSSLSGDLGLQEVVAAGLRASRHPATLAGGAKAEDQQFGSTITFSSKMGVSGGPSVTRTNFKGYGGAAGLANLSRTGTDTLVIAFAPKGAVPRETFRLFNFETLTDDQKSELLEAEAEAAARALLNRMVLQNLELFQP